MIDTDPVPSVDDNELLARFILHKSDYRSSDDTVRPQLFLPYSRVELSVNRHRDSEVEELWDIGETVAEDRRCNLYGRSDIVASKCRIGGLQVEAAPITNNANHANITGFPRPNPDQLSLAQKLAESASKYIPNPRR
jgi:hypothetical protein